MQSLHRYWEQRARTYEIADVYGRKILKEFLVQVNPQSLVEIGCGAGELFPLYRSIPRVVGCDFSSGMRARSIQRRDRHEWKHIEILPLDITRAALEEHFDVALTRTVLMHIHPDQIEAAAANVAKMADQLLLFEYYEQHYKPLGPHNWLYNYPVIFEKLGYEVREAYKRQDVPQTLFWFVKKP